MRQFRLCYVKFGYSGIIYLMLLGIVIGGHASLTLTSVSLLYCFVNVLNIWSLFFLLNMFCHAQSHLVTHCYELICILCFDLYTVCMNLVDATKHNRRVSHVTMPLVTN
jgi:hypothetical protein